MYKHKYLKYKQKYLELKGGSSFNGTKLSIDEHTALGKSLGELSREELRNFASARKLSFSSTISFNELHNLILNSYEIENLPTYFHDKTNREIYLKQKFDESLFRTNSDPISGPNQEHDSTMNINLGPNQESTPNSQDARWYSNPESTPNSLQSYSTISRTNSLDSRLYPNQNYLLNSNPISRSYSDPIHSSNNNSNNVIISRSNSDPIPTLNNDYNFLG
jgi:hypothetical protein